MTDAEKGEKKTIQNLCVMESTCLAEGVYSVTLSYPKLTAPKAVRPGQFVGVMTKSAATLLPRPISICEWDDEEKLLRLVYRVVGEGTKEFSLLKEGDMVEVLGILGNGYNLDVLIGNRVLLLGGGIGAPPMLGLAKALQRGGKRPVCVMGYRTNDLFLSKEFEQVSELVIATDDGTAGIKGNVVDAAKIWMQSNGGCVDVICACGPLPMLRGVKNLSRELHVPAYISLEERMACGIGACLGCVVKTTRMDAHSHVCNARICTEGPVFLAEDVEIG